MKRLSLIKFIVIYTGFLLAEPPTTEAIQDSLITRFKRIEDYSVKIKVSVKMTGLRMPLKKIKLYYKSPNKIKVETKGFAVVPKTGLGGSPNKYLRMLQSIQVNGNETFNGRNHWHLWGTVIPDSLDLPIDNDHIPEIKMHLWVDGDSWVISRVETLVDSQKVFQLISEYTAINGIYLPSKTTFSMGFKGMEKWSMRDPFGGPGADRHDYEKITEEAGVDPKKNEFAGTVTMIFSKYKVNQGIDDSIFEE